MGQAFDKIAAGLGDAIAYAEGDKSRGRVAGIDLKAVRTSLGKTQEQFADSFGLPVGSVRDWEQGRRQQDAAVRVLLTVIAADPVRVEQIIAGSR